MPPIVVLPELDVAKEVSETDGHVEMDFLMPNGIFIPYRVDFYDSVENLKLKLWKEAENYPLFKTLKRKENYCFVYINQQGQKDEIMDEDMLLNEFKIAARFLKLVEKQADNTTQSLTRSTNSLIGMKGQQCIDHQAQVSPDITDFRRAMSAYCKDIVNRRNQDLSGFLKFQYKHPVGILNHSILPEHIQNQLKGGMVLSVHIEETGVIYTMRIGADKIPNDLIAMTLEKWKNNTGNQHLRPTDYILKVIGLEDYLYGEYQLRNFKYIFRCLLRNTAPALWLRLKSKVMEVAADSRAASARSHPERPGKPSVKGRNTLTSWDIHVNFKLTINKVSKIIVDDNSKVRLFVGLFHGPETLRLEHTKDAIVYNGDVSWKKEVEFDIKVEDIPRDCRLCFALYIKKNKEYSILTWANIPVFDYKCRLLKGNYRLHMWTRAEHMEHMELYDSCNPIGTVAMNPKVDHSTILEFMVPDFNVQSHIMYPQNEKVLQCASENMEEKGKPGSPNWHPSKTHIIQFEEILNDDKSGIRQLAEQEKSLIWMMRYEIRDKYDYALPLLLNAVKWDNHIDVSKMMALLQSWRPIELQHALALLDFHYTDTNVREFACKCLEELSDDDLSQYMLQLVQALKYESHLMCPLSKFLLSRALENQHLGHHLYWLLRSEMHEITVTVRYGLLLEAYLKSSQEHLAILSKQQDALVKLNAFSEIAKNINKKPQKVSEDVKRIMHQKVEVLSGLYSPLTPQICLKDLLVDRCKIMDSKKRPLWLEWTNADPKGPNILIMYKNGDDLRQDMLTLQILQIMDNIWKNEGLDLRMNPYGCIATGREEGMIEIVTNSMTISKIQRWYKKGAFAKEALYEWLKHKNPKEESLSQAVEEFTFSCAGYAVATYILGIGDRHNDNIMMKESGQLFHIDFGHFLGNFKSKLNIKRERVPFILTSHFEYVIKRGEKDKENFDRFQRICEQAYMIIRSQGALLIRLFMMMLSAGIPQLTNVSDVDYLKDTLALDLTEEEARKKFIDKLKEAKNKSWSTSVNWALHNMAH
ncbi:phosphatidylinositol 4,5-bisphosphate 3-kinase catalytic subunit delta isoform-like [Crassostrea angulata]|uniref:phosphatidylinositol 4,5-bisphosphate 3-kinase catalytic subunit delta isoform-like n=1 Tax=Magallana angulata TaxID=2784310 RepID=UPI0022B19E31|nr:phosphatidylinositol 4,5-bisphosphate 3-kinase catalytic subunit delta isoform-like [Crassostrea angulata]